MQKYKKIISSAVLCMLLSCILLFSGCKLDISSDTSAAESSTAVTQTSIDLSSVVAFKEINNNKPQFKKSEITTESYEYYSDLDELGRCGLTMACIGQDIMPTEKRGSIGMVKPTGWHTVKYDFVDGKYLYNRCHLIGFQLAGENANTKNLITGTRYFNTVGMLPFENQVADYVKETGNHVMYRVIPDFNGDDLVATGVSMEAYSVEDNGKGVSFNVFVYNIQPGVEIDYHTGESKLASDHPEGSKVEITKQQTFIVNKGTKKFHTQDCEKAKTISHQNKKEYVGTAQELIEDGYSPCQTCRPGEQE